MVRARAATSSGAASMTVGVFAVAAGTAGGPEQFLLFVVAQQAFVDVGAARQFPDPHVTSFTRAGL